METRRMKWAVKTAGAGALALMMAMPAFAASRNDRDDRSRTTQSQNRDRGSSRTYRDNERVQVQGRVSSFSRERDGYRVYLDRGRDSYWVPNSYFRSRGRDLRVGISIGLAGIFRGGAIYVDAVSWPGDRGYRDDGYYGRDSLAGTVVNIDRRADYAEVRDARSGRVVRVDFRDARDRRLTVDDLRRGDYVELSGNWSGGYFEAYDIDAVRDRR